VARQGDAVFFDPDCGHACRKPVQEVDCARPIGLDLDRRSQRGSQSRTIQLLQRRLRSPARCHVCVRWRANRGQAIRTRSTTAETTGEFVVNLATWELREAMTASSASVRECRRDGGW